MSNGYKLSKEILRLSEAKSWPLAVREWFLETVYFEDEPDVCLCGHTPIKEVCILRNTTNGNTALVGNVCVKKFLGLPSDKIFQSVKRVQKDETKSLNADALAYALRKNWINDWEHSFYLSIIHKRLLSVRQASKKGEINKMFLERMRKTVADNSHLNA